MSVRIMSMVFERYPAGGNELLLALALADHAHDDGTHVHPRVASLAQKTRQSVRAVQYQLRRMQLTGWLIKCGSGDGGRGRSATYCLNPAWLKGADIAPFTPESGPDDEDGSVQSADASSGDESGVSEPFDGDGSCDGVGAPDGLVPSVADGLKGAATVAPFSETERVQPDVLKGAIAVAPAITNQINHHYSPISPHEGKHDSARSLAEPGKTTEDVSKPKGQRKTRGGKPSIGIKAYLENCRVDGRKPVPADDPVFAYVDKVGIPRDMLHLHWAEFKRRHLDSDRRYKDWLKTLRNSVRSNWYGIWAIRPGGECVLTTKGHQAQADHREDGE